MSRHKEDGKFVYGRKHAGRVRVDPSVTSIPNKAFFKRSKLAAVELSEGLVEIGDIPSLASITKISIPTHSGGLTIMPSHARFELPFSFTTTTLRALEEAHSHPAYLPLQNSAPHHSDP